MGNPFSKATSSGAKTPDITLKLLISVLPLIHKLSNRLMDVFGKDDEDDEDDERLDYLINIRTSAIILNISLNIIQNDGKATSFESEINQLADCLEEIFSSQLIGDSNLNISTMPTYPRLHAVLKIVSTSYDWELNIIKFFDAQTLEKAASWDELQSNLRRLTDQLQAYGDNLDMADEFKYRKVPQEPSKATYDFISRALGAINCRCHVESERELMWFVGSCKNGTSMSKLGCLCILASRDEAFLHWYELLIHEPSMGQRVVDPSKTAVSTNDAGQGKPDISASDLCVCNFLNEHTEPDSLQLQIDLHDDRLHPSHFCPDVCIFESKAQQGQIDLKKLLSCNGKTWTESNKWELNVALAYGLLYLYSSPSLRWQWRRDNIFFLKSRTENSLQPLLRTTKLQRSEETMDTPLKFHNNPLILELGVILLEIQLGKRLQYFLEDNRDLTNPNELYLGAWRVYLKKEPQIMSIPCRNVIQACLSPRTFEGENDVYETRALLFEKIVRPLEKEFLKNLQRRPDINNWEERTTEDYHRPLSVRPSKSQSTYSGSNRQYQRNNSVPPVQDLEGIQAPRERNTDAKLSESFSKKRRSESHDTTREKRVKWGDEAQERSFTKAKTAPFNMISDKTVSPTSMLSDAREHAIDKRAISDWAKWLKDFTLFRRQILPYPVDHENQQRVRVTVIDTGIDGSHPYILSKRWRSKDENATEPLFCDFAKPDSVRKHDPIDEDGHGTFIAGILLQISPDIELSVARIGVTRASIQDDAQIGNKISLAIEYAINTWETDIISMSFGSEQISYAIRGAIKEALKKNTIILAAAGNSGNHASIPYPAKLEGVFKIFAADTSGFAANFSPPVDDRDSHNSYFILGSEVVSTWPLGLQEQAEADGLKVFCAHSSEDGHEHSEHECDIRAIMSGTSFATPIAAALVAIIYQFYDANKSEITLREGSTGSFKSPEAIRAIFYQMSRFSERAPYNFLVPDRGRENYFQFQRQGETGLNNEGKTPIEFFSKKLSDIVYSASI